MRLFAVRDRPRRRPDPAPTAVTPGPPGLGLLMLTTGCWLGGMYIVPLLAAEARRPAR